MDCLSVLSVARVATKAAIAHGKVLARVWIAIACAVDDDISTLVESDLWQLIRAHLSIDVVGQATAHSCKRLTMVD